MSVKVNADQWSATTKLVHLDKDYDGDSGVSPAIMQSVNYTIRDAEHFGEVSVPLGPKLYNRRGNPTSSRLAHMLAQLEGTEGGLMFASGMAATSTTMLAFLQAGDHVIGQASHYIGSGEMLDKILPKYGVESTRVDQTSVEAFEAAIRPNTKMIILETPVNPLMHITDLQAVCDVAKAHGILTFCDNTFATPLNQNPAKLGVDIIMHSVTKYIGGHHDLLAGCILASEELLEKIWDLSMTFGSVGTPFNSWLALRGLRTLELRIRQHNANALAIAKHLKGHPAVNEVFYPGLESHPQYDLACKQMSGFGGLLTFDLKKGYEAGQSFLNKLALVDQASSLGGVSSVAMQPSVLFGGRLPKETVEKQGLTPGMIRLACGIENTPDLLSDIDQALRF